MEPSGNLIAYAVNYFFLSEHVEEQLAQSLQVFPSWPLVAQKVRSIVLQYSHSRAGLEDGNEKVT